MTKKEIITFAFIDASNIIYRGTDKNPWKIDLKKLIKYLKERFNTKRVLYYAGVENTNQAQLGLYKKMKVWGYEMKLNKVKYFVNEKGEWYSKADVDARMVFEMMKYFNHYDQAVVLTGDGDFYWALEYLIQKRKRIWLIASPSKTAKELKQLFGHRFNSLDDTRKWLEFRLNKKEAEPTNVSASGITKKRLTQKRKLVKRRNEF